MKKKISFITAVALFLLFVVAPLGLTFFSSIRAEGHFSLKYYESVFTAEKQWLLWRSCLIALSVALVSTALGGILGWAVSKTDVPFAGFFKLAFLVPLFISPFYFAVAWKDFFTVLGIGKFQNSATVMFVLSVCFFPLPMLIFSSAFENINRHFEEAGLLVGSRLKVLFSLQLPLIRPAVFSSLILVFILAVSEMSVATYFLVPTYASDIFIQFAAFYNHEAAIAASFLLVLICMFLLFLERSYLMQALFLSIGPKGNPVKKTGLKSFRLPLFFSLVVFWAFITVAPVAVLAYQSFQAPPLFTNIRNNLVETEGGGEKGFYFGKAYSLLKPVIPESLLYAAIGAAAICLFGFIFGYFAQRKGYRFIDFILLICFAVPATVFGIGLIKFYNRPVLEFIYTSFLILLIAYVGKFTFISSKLIGYSIAKIPLSLEQSATLMGAGSFKRMTKIVTPLASGGIFVAFLVCFIFCLGEIGTSIVIYPPGSSLLPITIATSMHNTPEALMSSMVLLALMVTMLALVLLFIIYYLIFGRTTDNG